MTLVRQDCGQGRIGNAQERGTGHRARGQALHITNVLFLTVEPS